MLSHKLTMQRCFKRANVIFKQSNVSNLDVDFFVFKLAILAQLTGRAVELCKQTLKLAQAQFQQGSDSAHMVVRSHSSV